MLEVDETRGHGFKVRSKRMSGHLKGTFPQPENGEELEYTVGGSGGSKAFKTCSANHF